MITVNTAAIVRRPVERAVLVNQLPGGVTSRVRPMRGGKRYGGVLGRCDFRTLRDRDPAHT